MKQHKLTRPIPDAWVSPLDTWELALRAANNADGTLTTRVRHMRQVARGFEDQAPEDVTGEDLLEWCGHQRWQPETRRSYYASIRSFFRWLSKAHSLEDASSVLPSVRCNAGKPHPLPEAVLDTGLDESAERTRLILTLAACAGLRACEVAVVHARDIFQQDDGLYLTAHGKGGKDRDIPLLPWLGQWLLLTCAHNGGYAFPGQIDGHLSARWISKLGSQALPSAWTLHSARHRFATKAYRVERDLLTVQRLLGHSSVATTQRYAEPPSDALRAAIQATEVHHHF